jgi:long-chain acyl-CoA synthetase
MSDSIFNSALFRPPLEYPQIPYHEMLREAARKFTDKIAIVFKDLRITFRELDALVNSMANALRGLGVTKGDKVALFMMNRPEWIISFQATARIGAIPTPLNPSYKKMEVSYQVKDSEAKVLITQEALYPIVQEARADMPDLKAIIVVGAPQGEGTLSFDDLLQKSSPKSPPPVDFNLTEDLVALPYSSGTTGLPKGTMLTQYNLLTNHIQFISSLRITSQDNILIFLPFYHIYGTMLMGSSIYAGVTQILMERFDMVECLTFYQKYRVTLGFAVPPILVAMANYPELKRYNFSSLRFILTGAAPLAPEVGRAVRELTGVRVIQGYGLTEASPLTHASPVDGEVDRLESVGLSISDQEQKIVDVETGEKELGPEEVGEVIVRGPHVMKGYWKNPEATQQAIRNDWLYTGDIGKLDKDGFLYIVDRKKEMIKYKGFGIAPAELEAVLFQHSAVADCAVFSKPDVEAGEVPKGVVVLKKNQPVTAEELMTFVEERVAGYKKIREIEFIEAIPKTASGKILRRVLKERERERLKN